jgi:hypothetical protein
MELVSLKGDHGMWTIDAGDFGKLPVLYSNDLVSLNGFGLPSVLRRGEQSLNKHSWILDADYYDAIERGLVVLALGDEKQTTRGRSYVGVFRVSDLKRPTRTRNGAITLREMVAAPK